VESRAFKFRFLNDSFILSNKLKGKEKLFRSFSDSENIIIRVTTRFIPLAMKIDGLFRFVPSSLLP